MNVKTIRKIFFLISIFLVYSSACVQISHAAELIGTKGKLTYLRVHALGSAYGPPQDRIDVEVVIKLDTNPNKSFGFQLRENNNDTGVREAMFNLLQDAFNNNYNVTIDYWIDPGKKNGVIHRVTLTK